MAAHMHVGVKMGISPSDEARFVDIPKKNGSGFAEPSCCFPARFVEVVSL